MDMNGVSGVPTGRPVSPSGFTASGTYHADDVLRFEAVLKNNKDTSRLEPVAMLQQQTEIMQTTVGADLGAKVAGGLAQAINKLVSMA